MKLRLIRHATIILTINNKTLLVDPILSEKGTSGPVSGVPNQNPNPLVELPVPLELLTSCDAALITHTHGDHFDEEAANKLPKDMQIFCQPQDTDKILQYGFKNVTPVCRHTAWEGISIARTSARHGYGITARALAPVSGFVIRGQSGPAVYIAGDSVFYSGTRKTLEKHKPGIVICNAGNAMYSGKNITMGINDIHQIHNYSPDAKIIAVHMEAWNHCVLTREILRKNIIESNLQHIVYVPDDGDEILLAE